MASGWTSLAGNHERQLLALRPGQGGPSDEYAHSQLTSVEFEWIRSLESSARLNEDIFACHGTPRSDCEYFLETLEGNALRLACPSEIADRLGKPGSRVVLCGHTHIPRAIRIAGGPLVVNPGSVGLPAYRDDHPVPHVVETGSPDARYAILERTATAWSTYHVAVPYDHHSMAALARERARPDWEQALLTGFVG